MTGPASAYSPELPLLRVGLRSGTPRPERYPFTLPILRDFEGLDFRSAVTFLVGDNGSGKSTLLEAVALAADATAVGADDLAQDVELHAVRELADALRLTWSRRTRRGFFLRAEDFLGFGRRVTALRAELERAVTSLHDELGPGPAFVRAAAPYRNQLAALRAGGDPLRRSHGERFLDVFGRRLVPGGLYLLDEPEVALSPMRVLAFMTLVRDAERGGAQFMIATHSPVLLAYPGAVILDLDGGAPRPVAYDDLAHVRFTRDFLAAPERFVRHLDDQNE